MLFPHRALSYPVPVGVSWEETRIIGAKGTVTPLGHSGPQVLDEEEHAPQNSINILSSLAQKGHNRREWHNQALVGMEEPATSTAGPWHERSFLYCNLTLKSLDV